MERKVVWTERASQDIEAIVRYVARRDPVAAGQIGFGIYDRVQILIRNPEAGSAEPDLENWRKLIFRRWKILYRLHDETIIVGRVWPAAKGRIDLHESI